MQRAVIPITGLAGLLAFLAPSLSTGAANPADTSKPSGKIAFVRSTRSGAQLLMMNADGSGQRQLTSGRDYDFEPDWSPDGRTIVYAHQYAPVSRQIHSDIFAVDVSGRQRRLTSSPLREFEPSWSPGGRRVAFTRDFDLYVMNRNGTKPRQLTRLGSVSAPAWSPDGRRIAFSLFKSPGGIRVINADGSGLRRLQTQLPRRGLWAPAWSPDGRKIAFSTSSAIYVITVNGSDQRLLTRRAQTRSGFAWSPDGRKIVYERAGGGGIYTIDVHGSRDRRLTRSTGSEFAWSPDGRTIAYASDGDIYVMTANGHGQRQLTDTPEVDGAVIWSPERARRVTAVAAAELLASKQRIAVSGKGDRHKFVLTPLTSGELSRDSGTFSDCCWSERVIVRDGQRIEINDPLVTYAGQRGTLVVRYRIEWVNAGNRYTVGTGTWKIVRATGVYEGTTGGGRSAAA